MVVYWPREMKGLCPTPRELHELKRVAMGETPADIVLKGDVANVYTKEVLKGHFVAVKGRWIAYVGPEEDGLFGEETKFIDLSGLVLVPGMIDAHAHLSLYCRPDEFLLHAVTKGVTTVVTELGDLAFKVDLEDLLRYIRALGGQPVKVFFTLPPYITLSETAKGKAPTLEERLRLLQMDEVLGLGEAFWQEALRGVPGLLELASEALQLKKTLEGHTAGCRGRRLQAYTALGFSSCHEAIRAEEALERLRLGLCVMIREGGVRRDLGEVLGVKDLGVDLRRVCLVSDGLDPEDLLEVGYMDHILQKAIDGGLDPLTALQMVTINPAEHFGLDGVLGGIAPGRRADMVAIPDLRTISPQWVMSDGEVVVEEGKPSVSFRRADIAIGGLRLPRPKGEDFTIRVPPAPRLRVRVIDQVTDLLTKELVMEMAPEGGQLRADPGRDVLKVALASEGGVFTALIHGLGLREGAMATSSLWEAAGVVVVGHREEEMARAVERVLELGGGAVLVRDGRVLEEVPLPIASTLSDLPLEELVERLRSLSRRARELGFRWAKPVRTLEVLTTPAIPFLRLSDRGLVDLRRGGVGLVVEG